MSIVNPEENRHIRQKNYNSETLLNLIAAEKQASSTIPDDNDADFGLLYSPLRINTTDKWVMTTGPFNHPPEINTTQTNYTLKRGNTLTINFSATDNNNDVLTWTKPTATHVGSINTTTGVYTYTPNLSTSLDTKTVTIRVTDHPSNNQLAQFAEITIYVNVIHQNRAPTLWTLTNRTVYVDSTIRINLIGEDLDETDQLTYEKVSGAGGNLDVSTGVFTYTPTQMGNTIFSFRVGDGESYSTTRSITITAIARPVNPPVITGIINKTIYRNTNFSWQCRATNPKNQTLTWAATTSSTSSAITLSISSSGRLSFRRTNNSTTNITVTVTDEDGLFDTEIFAIHTITRPAIPILDAIPNRTDYVGSLVRINLVGSDKNNRAITYQQTGGDGGTLNEDTGEFSVVINTVGNHIFSFRVYNGDAYSASRSTTITTRARPATNPPVLAAIGNKTTQRNFNYSFRASATNPKNQTLTWSVSTTVSSSSITRLAISNNGLLRFRRTSNSDTPITITVTDQDGLFDSETINIKTVDPPPITPPVIIDPPVVVVPPPPPDRIPPSITITSREGGRNLQFTDHLRPYNNRGGNSIRFIATDNGNRITDTSQISFTRTNIIGRDTYVGTVIHRTYLRTTYRWIPNANFTWYQTYTITVTGADGTTASDSVVLGGDNHAG